MLRRALVLMSLVFGLLSSTTMAEDVFFRVRVQDIKFIDGDVPEYQAAQPDLEDTAARGENCSRGATR